MTSNPSDIIYLGHYTRTYQNSTPQVIDISSLYPDYQNCVAANFFVVPSKINATAINGTSFTSRNSTLTIEITYNSSTGKVSIPIINVNTQSVQLYAVLSNYYLFYSKSGLPTS